MQSTHHAIDRDFRKEASCVRANVDDAGMGACAEHNQSELPHMDDEHALVHQERIRFPWSIGASAAKVISAAFFKRAEPENFATVVKMPVEQPSLVGIVHHGGAVLLEFCE